MTELAVFGLAWCILSLVFLFRACAFLWSERRFDRTCVTATGVVVGEERRSRKVQASNGGRRQVSFSYPIVAFRTSDGREVRASPKVNVAHAYPVGADVALEYLPADPTRIRVTGDSVNRLGPGLAVGVGALFLLVGLGILFGALAAG